MDIGSIHAVQLPMLIRLTGSYVEAEDTLQSGLLIAIERWPDKPDDEINRILPTCLRHLYFNRLRNNRRRERREVEASNLRGNTDFDNEVQHERISVLREAIGALPGEFAEIVQRRYFGGENAASIAAAMKISVSTVNKRHRIAMEHLRRHFSRVQSNV